MALYANVCQRLQDLKETEHFHEAFGSRFFVWPLHRFYWIAVVRVEVVS